MTFNIEQQEQYSRLHVVLRAFLGPFYIVIPQVFLLFVVGIWVFLNLFIAWWVCLFTLQYPKSTYNMMNQYFAWRSRVIVSLWHMSDQYPTLGLNGDMDGLNFSFDYPPIIERSTLLMRTFLSPIYCGIPHGIALFFRGIASSILVFMAFFVLLFTGKYPKSWFDFNQGTIRWILNVTAYILALKEDYPRFSGLSDPLDK